MENAQPSPTAPLSPAEAPSVLVVDDNPVIARSLASLLKEAGYKATIFHTGLEALTWAGTNTPNAAVVDIHLPDISGLILSSKLRERFGDGRPIIVLSGDTSMETIGSLPYVGATYFISKPFKPDHLLKRLKELLPA